MKFKKNELVRIVGGIFDKERWGVHLKTIRYRGKYVHIVLPEGKDAPELIHADRMKCVPGIKFLAQSLQIANCLRCELLPQFTGLPC